MKTIMQAFTGGINSKKSAPDILKRLIEMQKKTASDTLLIGWNTKVNYKEIVKYFHKIKCEVYLWLPVFSEYGDFAVPAKDYQGNHHKNAISGAEDDFVFSCPSLIHNRDIGLIFYNRFFASAGFDGVFLDKIRFSSFGNGFHSGMGCFCLFCNRFYQQQGVDLSALNQMMQEENKNFLVPSSLTDMKYHFENEVIESFYTARADLITKSVKIVIEKFKEKDLKIGLDVYAPPFAYLFGQDIKALAKEADFIKPMLYRVTDAPAGIPYESYHLKKELLANGCAIGNKLEELWGVKDLSDLDSLKVQLDLLKQISCPVYPGVEVNKVAICKTNLEYVKENLTIFEDHDIPGWVMSWSVLEKTVYPSKERR